MSAVAPLAKTRSPIFTVNANTRGRLPSFSTPIPSSSRRCSKHRVTNSNAFRFGTGVSSVAVSVSRPFAPLGSNPSPTTTNGWEICFVRVVLGRVLDSYTRHASDFTIPNSARS